MSIAPTAGLPTGGWNGIGSLLEIALLEQVVPGKTLGRHVQHDPRSWNFPAREASEVVSVKHRTGGLPLNQEAHRCSTAHALCGVLGAAEKNNVAVTSSAAISIYERAREIDRSGALREIEGSSALMACKAARSMGLIDSYQHAFGIDHALRALVLGPVITGFSWYSSFDDPDPVTGLVEIAADATVRGGQEVIADEIDRDDELVWCSNSWGRGFGLDGRFCMTFETWRRLLKEQGDVTVPVS